MVRPSFLSFLVLLAAAPAFGAPGPALPVVSPGAISAGQATTVTVSVLVNTEGRRVLSVNLLKVDRTGKTLATLGVLNDLGTDGDLRAGDRIFSRQLVFNEPAPTLVRMRVSVAFQGVVLRSFSGLTVLQVLPLEAPTRMQPACVTQVVTEPDTGVSFLCDEILALTAPETPYTRVRALAENAGARVIGLLPFPRTNMWQLRIACGSAADLRATIQLIGGDPAILNASPNLMGTLDQTTERSGPEEDEKNVFEQTGFPQVWGLFPALLKSPLEAISDHFVPQLVAVVDSGVDYSHVDLQGRVIKGSNFATSGDPGDPMDTHGHGTAVAGVAGASALNGLHVAGALPAVWILAEKTGPPDVGRWIAGLKQAVDDGAKVINASWSTTPSYISLWPPPVLKDIEPLAAAIDYANAHGTLVIAAAGNHNCTEHRYPAAFASLTKYGDRKYATRVVAVGGLRTQPNAAGSAVATSPLTGGCCESCGSAWGDWVDVYAPYEMRVLSLSNTTRLREGTSFSAPLVSAAAALVWTLNQDLDADEVEYILLDTADTEWYPGEDGVKVPLTDPALRPIRRINALAAALRAACAKEGFNCPTASTVGSPIPRYPHYRDTGLAEVAQNNPRGLASCGAPHPTKGRGFRLDLDISLPYAHSAQNADAPPQAGAGIKRYEFRLHDRATGRELLTFSKTVEEVLMLPYEYENRTGALSHVACHQFIPDADLSAYQWTARAWDKDENVSAWSPPADIVFSPCRLDDGRPCFSARAPSVASNPTVSPGQGPSTSTFVFRAQYYDPDGHPPTAAQVVVDGWSTWPMSLELGSQANGTYTAALAGLAIGTHSFYVRFENGVDPPVTTPVMQGPVVTAVARSATRLVVTASPNPVQRNACTVLTATLTDATGAGVDGEVLTFTTGFPGALHGFPPPGCSGPSYEAGASGTTNAAGQVQKYFLPTAAGTAVVTVQSASGLSSSTGVSATGPSGGVSGSIYVRLPDVTAVLTQGEAPVASVLVTLTASEGTFCSAGGCSGSSFTDYTDARGAIGESNTIQLQTPSCTGFVVVTLSYPAGGFETATTVSCHPSATGSSPGLYRMTTLTTGGPVTTLAFAQDGSHLFGGLTTSASTGRKTLHAWLTSGWQQRFQRNDLRHDPISSAVRADNGRLAVGENAGAIEFFDLAGTRIGGTNDQSSDVTGVDWVASQAVALVAASGATSETIRQHGVYRVTESGTYTLVRQFAADTFDPPRTSLRHNAAKQQFAYGMVGGGLSHVYLHSASTPSAFRVKTLSSTGVRINDVAWSQAGEFLAVVGAFGGVQVLNTSDLSVFQFGPVNFFETVTYLGTTGLIAAGDRQDSSLYVFDSTGRTVFNPSLPAVVRSLAWSEPKRLLAVGLENGEIWIYGVDALGPAISQVVVAPGSYVRGTVFTISASLSDAAGGIDPTTAEVVVRDVGGLVVARVPMVAQGGDLYRAVWDSTGTTGAIYHVGISVKDVAGNVAEQQQAWTLDFSGAATVPAPTLTAVSPVSCTALLLSWMDNSAIETGFRVERSTDGTTWDAVTTVPADSTRFQDEGLQSLGLYYYRVVVMSGAYESVSNVLAERTLYCEPPVSSERIVFTRLMPSGKRDLWMTDPDGVGPLEQLTDEAKNGHDSWRPSIFPDGKRILFERDNNLWVLNLESREQVPLTTDGAVGADAYSSPSLSPDGTKIAFAYGLQVGGSCGACRTWEIYTVDIDAMNQVGAKVRVTNNGYRDAEAVFSPDGTKLLITHYQGAPSGDCCNETDLYVYDLTTREERRLYGSTWYDWASDWTDAGILFMAQSAWAGPYTTWFIDPSGTGLRPLVTTPSLPCDAVFSPDRSKILFTDRATGQLYTVSVSGGTAVPVSGATNANGNRGATWGYIR